MKKLILDVCCGPRMMWFNKNHPLAIYQDVRQESFVACDGRKININPDVIQDFRDMPYENNSFKLVVFDTPHFNKLGKTVLLLKSMEDYFQHGKLI